MRALSHYPLQFTPECGLAARVWLTRSVRQQQQQNVPETAARQLQSDKKWEGVSWDPDTGTSSASCKRKTKRARPCEDAEDDMELESARVAAAARLDADVPPRPASPVDDDAGDGSSMARRKDKDVVPSKQTWAWNSTASAWQLKPRPRIALLGPFFAFQPIPAKHLDLLRLLLNAPDTPLTETFLRTELMPRLNRDHKVSLRALDWLMVDYSCENKAVYMWPVGNSMELVDIHEKYTRLLKCWRRRRFDCFRRRHRIYFEMDDKIYSTTVAQLHFFYVASRYGFLEYARVFLDVIDAHMKATFNKVATDNARAAPKRQALVTKAKPRAFVNAAPKQWSFRYPDMPADDDDDDENDVK